MPQRRSPPAAPAVGAVHLIGGDVKPQQHGGQVCSQLRGQQLRGGRRHNAHGEGGAWHASQPRSRAEVDVQLQGTLRTG